jgi:hypothetical protein
LQGLTGKEFSMRQLTSRRDRVFTILPTLMLRAIAANGTPAQRARALDTLATASVHPPA